ncbi:hypothetical protein [Vreelandella sulfidaeris]
MLESTVLQQNALLGLLPEEELKRLLPHFEKVTLTDLLPEKRSD